MKRLVLAPTGRNVLVVGMPRLNSARIAATLDDLAVTVTAAHDTQMALHHLQRSSFDLCLLDLDRLGADAREAAATLQTADEHMPLIGLGKNRYDAELDEILARPFTPEELTTLVKLLLRSARATAPNPH